VPVEQGWVPDLELTSSNLDRTTEGVAPQRVPLRSLLAAVVVLAIALGVGAGVVLFSGDGDTHTVSTPARRTVSPATAASASGALNSGAPNMGIPGVTPAQSPTNAPGAGASPTGVVVDVVGRVRRPGLVRLSSGARVADAVAAAGGATNGAVTSRLNLARRLSDGEQILVPGARDAVPAAGTYAGPGGETGAAFTGQPPTAGSSSVVDLNTATEEQLDSLPGVGPVTAAKILTWRNQHQRFGSVDELGEVPGIGPKTLAQLRPLVTAS
jgi:competence protein ComEA